jgi:hypothetical protein
VEAGPRKRRRRRKVNGRSLLNIAETLRQAKTIDRAGRLDEVSLEAVF